MHRSAVFCKLSKFRPVSDRFAPILENSSAVAAPMPLEAPVIKATFPENFAPTCEAIVILKQKKINRCDLDQQKWQIYVQIVLIFASRLKAYIHLLFHHQYLLHLLGQL